MINKLLKREKQFQEDNISRMFRGTAIAMIFTQITGVVAVLIDGMITSRFLGVDVYAGISLLRPYSSMVLVYAGFFSTGCGILCSQHIGSGDKEGANEVFNLTVFLALGLAILVMILSFFFPTGLLRFCGVPMSKHPELNPHMYGYLYGYLVGVPGLMLVQVIGPILVMDNGKTCFTISSVVLCVVDIAGDLLNALYFKGGALGMGLVTTIGYYCQLIVVCYYLIRKNSYFRLSLKVLSPYQLPELVRKGSPALIKRVASTLRDIVTNYFNVILALTSAAIAAKGIQGDLFQFLFCIPIGLGKALVSMIGIYYSANDQKGLTRLYTYALRLGFKLSAAAGVITFIAAPLLTRIYSHDPEVISLTVFSIRWMSLALVFDTTIDLIQQYLQGTDNQLRANILSLFERFIVPVAAALILGSLYGSKGILASIAISKMILLLAIYIGNCIHCKRIPKYWYQVMFLPKGFGGDASDNLYEEIREKEDVVRVSSETEKFCLDHHVGSKPAKYMSLFVEEMSVNILEHAQKVGKKDVYADFRLFVNKEDICFSMMDLGDCFDPTEFYRHNKEKRNHLGLRIVMENAKEVRYFSAFNSNNLIVYLNFPKEDIV